MNENRYIEISEDEIDLREIFHVILKYKYTVIITALIALLLAAIYVYFKPNVYKATSTIEVSTKSKPLMREDILSAAISGETQDIYTEIAILKSRFVTSMALKEVDLQNHIYGIKNFKKIELYKNSPFRIELKKGYDIEFKIIPIDNEKFVLEAKGEDKETKEEIEFDKEVKYGEWIKNRYFEIKIDKIAQNLKFKEYKYISYDPVYLPDKLRENLFVSQFDKKAAIIEISFEDNIPLRAAEFVNAIANAYLRQSIERKTKEATKKLKFIDKQLKIITKNLQNSASALENFKKKSNTVDLSSETKMLIKKSADLEEKLVDISLKIEVLKTLFNQIKKGEGLENISVVGIGEDDSLSLTLSKVKQLQEAIIKKKELLQEFTNIHPKVMKINSVIEELKKSIFNSLKNSLEVLEEQKQIIKDSIEQQKRLINALPENERILANLQRNFEVNEKIYSYLLEKRSEVAITKAATINKNRVIDKAIVPNKHIKPKRKLILVVALITGLILGIFLAFLRAFINTKIESIEDIERATQVPVVAVIPHIKEADILVVLKSLKSGIAEAFRGLRSNLQFMVKKKRSYVVAVTSTVAAEGKTTISVNLSAIISLTNKKVIILNLDMRKPTLHEKFNLSNSKGMSTLLTGNDSLEEVIQHTNYKNLDVITSGPIPPNPSELLESEEFGLIIDKLKNSYDVVILDTPPVGLVTDARVVMDYSDVVLYILRYNYSKKEFIENINKLKKEGIKGLGIVFNDVKSLRKKYGYGYGYGYY